MRLIAAAAFRYDSSSVGDSACASAMLSKFALFWSSGSQLPASTSSSSRSLIALAYSGRLSRWKKRTAGCGVAGHAGATGGCARRRGRGGRVGRGRGDGGGGHETRLQLANHRLGNFRLLGRTRGVEFLERHIAALQLVVMTADAIPFDDGVLIGGWRRGLGP